MDGDADDLAVRRAAMVDRQLAARGIRDERVLQAMREVRRERLVSPELAGSAFADSPLPIGEGQTISQPFVVALMCQALELLPTDRVLEVGTGSGYAAAVLARLAARVWTIERLPGLAQRARERLRELGADNVEVVVGDGTLGWPAAAPYDAIVVAAGGPQVPPALLAQLAPGGRLVMPVGPTPTEQLLVRLRQGADGQPAREDLGAVCFVPLIGEQGWRAPGR